MTDISRKIEEMLREEFGSRFGIKSTKFATAHILKLIEEERAGWVERVAEEVEGRMLIEAEMPGSRWTLDWKQGHNAGLEKASAIIRNSKEV